MKRREKNPLEDADGVNIEWADRVEARILEIYKSAAPFRLAPPSEDIARGLLRHIQGDACFMCRCGDLDGAYVNLRGEHLVEDHDHETGMVRSLLCRSCNTTESMAGRRPWSAYRQFAPANGWYYRYSGRGEQWHDWNQDPLPWRMRFSAPPGFDDVAGDPRLRLASYLEVVGTMPATSIPITCQRRFEFDSPQLLPGERYKTNEEMRVSALGEWPIVGDAQPHSEVPSVVHLEEARLKDAQQARQAVMLELQRTFNAVVRKP